MKKHIADVVDMLRARGDYGTANAIVDAMVITRRARRMLHRSVKELDITPYYDEEQMLQVRIDLLRELINGES